MQINDPFQMNDWNLKKFLYVVLAIQLALCGAIGLDSMGLQIPILRQLIGFIYLTFVPGSIILRILRLHNLGNIETLLYTVGLSITTLMLTGLVMNILYPLVGISEPISITYLILTITSIILMLCILCYMSDLSYHDFSDASFIDLKNVLSPSVLLLSLIPFFALFGTYLVNFYLNNILLMLLIVILPIVDLLIAFEKLIPKNLYPLAVFIIAISLLFRNSLISMYIWGWDIHYELYLSNLIKTNSIWYPAMYGTCNAMLSVVMLAPFYSIITDMSITWVFKIIYPLLFSLVPLGLYRVFQKQTDDKIAFLSCFFFMSVGTFYIEMLALARQQIAELFFVILILLMIDKNMDKVKRSFLIVVFGASLVVSHYGLSYIYMFCLIFAWLISVSAKKFRSTRKPANIGYRTISRTISLNFVIFFTTFALTWYIYVSNCSAFIAIVHIGDHIAKTIFTDFLNPEALEGLKLVTAQPAPGLLHDINRVIIYINQIFIVIGCVVLLIKHRVMKFESEYATFSVLNLTICLAGIFVPFFASSLNMTRLYQISLIFLAPFCVIGGITFFKVVCGVVGASWTARRARSSRKILSVYFAIFLLYQSEFLFEAIEGSSGSISLNSSVDYPRFNDQEVSGAKWLINVKDNNNRVYADAYRWLLLGSFEWNQISSFRFEWNQISSFRVDADSIQEYSYVYLGTFNIINGNVFERSTYINSSVMTNDRDKIYDNDGTEVYYQ